MTSSPVPPHLQKLLSKHDAFLTAELVRVRDAPENQANAQGEHTELFYNLLAALSKTKGVNYAQGVDTVYDFLSRTAPEIHVPQSLDAGPEQMKRMREKMALYVVDEAHRATPAKPWWKFW